MPSRYRVKEYVAGGCYHVYNRGVEKRDIFMDERDYRFFLFLIKSYLTPAKDQKVNVETQLNRGAFVGKIDLLAYALMPNHYHLLIKQTSEDDLAEFMRAIMTTYVSYFNKKYDRTGGLFQGVYKAILVESDDYLLHLSRYVHLNPLGKGVNPLKAAAQLATSNTSYADYLGHRKTSWLNSGIILEYFEGVERSGLYAVKNYKAFIEDIIVDEGMYLGKFSIDGKDS